MDEKYKENADMKQYKVIHIIEPDFGCEGLPDGSVRMDQVILQDGSGVRITVEVADAYLYEQQIDEGDVVIRTEKGICKNRAEGVVCKANG